MPIAPSTAVCFLALAAAVVALARWPERRLTAALVLGAVAMVVVLAAHVLLQAASGVDLGLERALCVALGAPQTFPLGRMSPVAAALFLVGAGALVGRTGRVARRRFAADVSTSLAAIVLAGGLVFTFGYWLKAPVDVRRARDPARPADLGRRSSSWASRCWRWSATGSGRSAAGFPRCWW